MTGLADRGIRNPAGRSLPTIATHRRREVQTKKNHHRGGCLPHAFGLLNPVNVVCVDVLSIEAISNKMQQFMLVKQYYTSCTAILDAMMALNIAQYHSA